MHRPEEVCPDARLELAHEIIRPEKERIAHAEDFAAQVRRDLVHDEDPHVGPVHLHRERLGDLEAELVVAALIDERMKENGKVDRRRAGRCDSVRLGKPIRGHDLAASSEEPGQRRTHLASVRRRDAHAPIIDTHGPRVHTLLAPVGSWWNGAPSFTICSHGHRKRKGRFVVTKPLTRDAILEVLRSVNDPHIGKDIVGLGFVKEAEAEGERARVVVEFATPAFPSRDRIREECAEKLRSIGAARVDLDFRTAIRGYRPAGRQDLLKDVRNVIAVASGKGGVGKSTVAVNLALSLAKAGAATGLLDADVYGPSLGIMLGVGGRPEVTSNNTMRPIDAHGLKIMSIAFLTTKDTPVIWRGPMVHGLVYQFLTQVEWGTLDYLVIDLPPGTGDAQLTLTQTAPLAGSVIVTTPQNVSLVDARRGLKMFEQVHVPVLGIVENMSSFVCPHCERRTDIFRYGGGKKTSRELGVPFLGEVPIDPEVVIGGDAGTPIVVRNPASPAATAYVEIAERIAAALGRLAIEEGGKSASFTLRWDG